MRSLGTRRAVQVAGAATVAVIALAGCSAGQVAETAMLKTPISGLNTQSPDGGLLIRNLQVLYNSPEGYPAGGAAPLEVTLVNQTHHTVTVTFSSKPASNAGIVSAQQLGVIGPQSAAPAPSPSASGPTTPPTPTATPAQFTLNPLSSQSFLPGDSSTLQAIGLSGKLVPGGSLALVVGISGGEELDVTAPFAIPGSPAPRSTDVDNENVEGE